MENPTAAPSLTRKGVCLCGNIQFEITGEPVLSLLCHCPNCRKTSGSSFASNLFFLETQIKIIDDQKLLRTYDDSNTWNGAVVHREFCGQCGSSLFVRNDKMADRIIVSSGAVDDTTGWGPTREVMCNYRKDWLPEISGTEVVM